ncbi:protein HEADING DATE REPRESSOR 1 [Lycium barbarum]|uniref:protein HEADING DATE REPRESSOR 1 n=1 Tax=Lycium ferocissimum TaxID=112874 RepID=UPI002814EC8D|nr:protein HEADING DATE REPRESSOR 1 [Lycium ferocissimum]XP_060205292.1 protein HEADING DATE REPRESSOR 1 [Lycium barbarum]
MEVNKQKMEGILEGFSPVTSTPVFWKSRKRSASVKNLDNQVTAKADETPQKQEESSADEKMQESQPSTELTERRKALFEPLEPVTNANGRRPSAESLLPPPDFDAACYPKGWLAGKRRKLVNVDVVESMRRIALQEMNRKDREIDGLNEQLEADAQCLEHLQIQLLEERSKRADVERQNATLQSQINMLMNMMQDNDDGIDDEGTDDS